MTNQKLYIHELIDIHGHNRARYMHHMTANWVPVGLAERDQKCFGVFATVGSTGRWPEVVNLWELDGWDGLVHNFEVEFAAGRSQDPSLAEWWAAAASLRRGGVDRILVPAPWTSTIEELTAAGVRGEVYAHELVTLPNGGAAEFLQAVRDLGRPTVEATGVVLVGAWRTVMGLDDECILLWAFRDWQAWARYEQGWAPGGELKPWRDEVHDQAVVLDRSLLVDAPLSPLRIGRQPEVGDRVPLDEIR